MMISRQVDDAPRPDCPVYGACLATADHLEECEQQTSRLVMRIGRLKAALEEAIAFIEAVEEVIDERDQPKAGVVIDRFRSVLSEANDPEGDEG